MTDEENKYAERYHLIHRYAVPLPLRGRLTMYVRTYCRVRTSKPQGLTPRINSNIIN